MNRLGISLVSYEKSVSSVKAMITPSIRWQYVRASVAPMKVNTATRST
ncbi:hypothetical protein [Pontibacterium sp.]